MNFKDLFADDRAVSPVIGVILMVAITVILAAVIGTFVLGLGSGLQQTAPQATFSINSTQLDKATGNATITHSTGDSIEAGQLSISGDITSSGSTWNAFDTDISSDTTKVSAGDDAQVDPNADSGTIRIVWKSAQGDNSATLQKWNYT